MVQGYGIKAETKDIGMILIMLIALVLALPYILKQVIKSTVGNADDLGTDLIDNLKDTFNIDYELPAPKYATVSEYVASADVRPLEYWEDMGLVKYEPNLITGESITIIGEARYDQLTGRDTTKDYYDYTR